MPACRTHSHQQRLITDTFGRTAHRPTTKTTKTPRRTPCQYHQERLPGIKWPPAKPRTVRYPFCALETLARLPETILCERLRISWKTLKDYRTDGIDTYRADELAGRINRHPTEIWSNWK